MQELFCRVLEISFTGCFCICIVLPIRLLLLKYGRKYAYYLWLAVFLNLVIPFSIQGTFSLIPRQAVDFSVDVEAQTGKLLFTRPSKSGKKTDIANSVPLGNNPQTETVQQNKDRLYPTSIQQVAHSQPNKNNRPLFSIDTLQTIWIVGLIGIMVYNIIHMILFKRLISLDKWVHWNESERIAEVCGLPAPFLWGMIRPIIFLPSALAEEEKLYITMHEKYHRKRGDAYLKLAAYAVAALHWFNPAVWAAWILFCRDMEISCDEAVLENPKKDIRCQYAQSLLQYAAGRNGYVVTPPIFGEPSAKTKIQSILRFQKRNPYINGPLELLL